MVRRNVLIFHLGALGDFVLTWPLAAALGRLFPQSRIIYITHSQKGELVSRTLHLEAADIENGWHRLQTAGASLPATSARLLRGAHLIVDYMAGPLSARCANFRALAPQARVLALDPVPSNGASTHASEHVLDQMRDWPAVHQALRQMLSSITQRGLGRSRERGRDILVHPGSGSREKCWPLEKFIQLVERLRCQRLPLRILLGEVEMERWSTADVQSLAALAPVCNPATYTELFEVLCGGASLIANDSGPTHLAGIMGLPTLALFGPTDPTVWRPLGPRVRILRRQPLHELCADEVHAAAVAMLQ